jgi:hypothetical protein
MALNPSQSDTAAGVFLSSDETKRRPSEGSSQRAISRKGPSWFARWKEPRSGLYLLLALAGNVLVATLAWIVVRLVTG